MIMAYSHLDLLGLAVFALCWFGYDWYAKREQGRRPSLLTVMNPLRERWFMQTLTRENRIVDTGLVANLMHSSTFFSSTTILVLGALLALLGSLDQRSEILENLPFAKETTLQLLETKVVLLIVLFVYALIKFIWSVRQFNFVTIMVGSIAAKNELTDEDAVIGRKAGGILKLAGENFSQGLRAYHFAAAALFWFVQPVAFIIGSVVVTVLLYRMEFRSRTLEVLLDKDIERKHD